MTKNKTASKNHILDEFKGAQYSFKKNKQKNNSIIKCIIDTFFSRF